MIITVSVTKAWRTFSCPHQSVAVTTTPRAATLIWAFGWPRGSAVGESVTTASTTLRDIGARGANQAFTETEGSPCLLQRSANVSDRATWGEKWMVEESLKEQNKFYRISNSYRGNSWVLLSFLCILFLNYRGFWSKVIILIFLCIFFPMLWHIFVITDSVLQMHCLLGKGTFFLCLVLN